MGDSSVVRKHGFCTLCRSRCGAVYEVDGDRLVGVEPDSHHPTGGALCSKGRAAPELVHSPRRLTSPLKRTNPKSADDPGWVEIGWDEALDIVAERIAHVRDVHGPEGVAFAVTSPSGTPMSDSIDWVERLARTFGSPNIAYATEVCNWHKDHAHAFTYGRGIATPDYANADLILLWGHNPARSWLAQSAVIADAQARGARVAVVDPRKAGSAQTADLWLRVRPGTDAALALGVAHLLIDEGRYDAEFVRRWTNGPLLVRRDAGRFLRGRDVGAANAEAYVVHDGDRLRAYDTSEAPADSDRFVLHGAFGVDVEGTEVECEPAFALYARECAQWTPSWVEAVSWVPASDVRALADAIADAESVAYYSWTGVGQHTNATQTDRAIACLYALTGSAEKPGGNVVTPAPPTNPITSFDQLAEEQRAKTLGRAERPVGPPSQGWVTAHDLYETILDDRPYPIRALIGFGANSLVSQADTTRGRQALQRLDFHVHCNPFMTPTAELADIVLPVNTPWEREGLRLGFELDAAAQELVQLRQPMVPSIGLSRSDMQIVFELATRLGLSEAFFNGDIDAAWEWVLEPLPFGLADLRTHPEGLRVPLRQRYTTFAERTDNGVRGFETPTRRVELYSERLLRHGYDPLPSHIEPIESPEPGTDLPYVLTSTKSAKYCHSQHRGVASLRARAPEPTADISPQLAQQKGIADGDWVHLRTRRGRIRMRARHDVSLHPHVVVSEYGWWEAAPDLGLRGYDPFDGSGSNYNRLVDPVNVDPVSGSVPMRATVCDVERVDQSRWTGTKQFSIACIERESWETVTLRLVPIDGKAPPGFAPGQHIEVTAGQLVTDAESGTRSYSLSGAVDAAQGDALRITVKREGVVSRHLVDAAVVGDVVDVTAPAGRFRLPTEPDLPVVLVAGGVGITPFMGYLEHMARERPDAEIHLLYSSRDKEHEIFGERLRDLAAAMPGLRVRTYFTRPTPDDLRGINYHEPGRITADAVAAELIERRARIYVCGPDAMITDLRTGLVERGVPAYDIFSERFTTPAPTWEPDPSARHRVTFARSGRTADWQASAGTLLDLAEREGVAISAGCRSGECETCMVSVSAGSVRYLVAEADPDDDGQCLACQAVPVSDLTLDA